MESSPSPIVRKIIESAAWWLIPPACREEVLGDLRERDHGSVQYFFDAATAIPCVIYSRIRRTTDAVLAVVEAASMYTMVVLAAWWLDRSVLLDRWGYVRLAIPPAIILIVTILSDAYGDPLKRGLHPALAPLRGFWLAFLVQLNLLRLSHWGLPGSVFGVGVALAWLTVATLRIVFTPVPDRPRTVNYPPFWQKLELHPISSRIADVLLPSAIVVATILYFFRKN
jgi:hypothetical protein